MMMMMMMMMIMMMQLVELQMLCNKVKGTKNKDTMSRILTGSTSG